MVSPFSMHVSRYILVGMSSSPWVGPYGVDGLRLSIAFLIPCIGFGVGWTGGRLFGVRRASAHSSRTASKMADGWRMALVYFDALTTMRTRFGWRRRLCLMVDGA